MMNIMAVYHASRLSMNMTRDGLSTIRKGRHVLCAQEFGSDGELISGCIGYLRNRSSLTRELALSGGAPLHEIAIAAYRRWGAHYPEHLEGPVSTVLIDRSIDRMVVSRDRMGDTRMFYCRRGRTVAASDHPDALADSPYASRIVDSTGLNEIFALGPARTPGRTPYRDIMALEPGCLLCAERSGVSVRRYYSLNACPHEDDVQTTVQRVRELLDDSVEGILSMTDASMLSGGLDSTALTALMRAKGKIPMTFSVDYEGDEADFTGNEFQPERDREYAAMAAELFSREHKNVILDYSELASTLGAAVEARGFPGMADIDSSLLLFGKAISNHTNNVVSGECGDEVFCGYPWFKREKIAPEKGFPWSGSMELRSSILKKDAAVLMKPEKYARETFLKAYESVPRVPGESKEDDILRRMQSVCFRFFMSNLQERALCMCAASAVTVLTPFSDERLVEYVWNVPGDIKFLNGETKGLLREAVSDLLPEKLLRRRKSPYPKVYSPLYTRRIREMIKEMLSDKNEPVFKVVEHSVIKQLADSDLPAGGFPWFGQLMSGPQMLAYIWQVNYWLKTRRIEISI